MLASGLMILNAHPRLYWGHYGANAEGAPDPAWLEFPERFGGLAFPGWLTLPSYYSLADARALGVARATEQALAVLTEGPQRVLGASLGTLQASVGRIAVGGVADLCIFDPNASWTVQASALRSQGKHTPFGGHELPARQGEPQHQGQLR